MEGDFFKNKNDSENDSILLEILRDRAQREVTHIKLNFGGRSIELGREEISPGN